MTHYLHSWQTWLNVLLVAPIFWIIAFFIIRWVGKQYQNWFHWYKGLAIIQYPALFLVVIGCKVLRTKHCKVMTYNNRTWLSPETSGFIIDPEVRQ